MKAMPAATPTPSLMPRSASARSASGTTMPKRESFGMRRLLRGLEVGDAIEGVVHAFDRVARGVVGSRPGTPSPASQDVALAALPFASHCVAAKTARR